MKGARAREGPRVPHAEAYERMNFLYQAAHQVMPTNPDLARQYIHQMVLITRRLVLRIDPAVKETFCKRCYTLLIPGITSSTRISPDHSTHQVVSCLHCGSIKRKRIRQLKPTESVQTAALDQGSKEVMETSDKCDNISKAPSESSISVMPGPVDTSRRTRCLEVPKNHHSRFIYTNPVCLLSVSENQTTHLAFLSRLTCINNNGYFFCSMSSRLPAAQLLSPATRFGMEEMLLPYVVAAEDVSEHKKEDIPLAIDLCRPGWFPLSSTDLKDEASTDASTRRRKQKPSGKRPKKDIAREELDTKLKDNRAIEPCVAHIECVVESRDLVHDQTVLYAMIERVWVQAEYWTGKTFACTRSDVPPYLAYLGNAQFGYKIMN